MREADRPVRGRGRAARRHGRGPSEAEDDGSVHVSLPSAVADGAAVVREGRIGQLRTDPHASSPTYNDDPQNIRNQADIGGGALMDIGCYPISLSRFIFDAEPERVLGHIERDPNTHVDRLVSASSNSFKARRLHLLARSSFRINA